MKRMHIALAIVGIIVLAWIADTYANGITAKATSEIKDKVMKFMHRWRHAGHGKNCQYAWKYMLNYTRMEGVLQYENGSYYLDGMKLYVGNDFFLDSIAKSDYDGDGEYEYVWQELNGLVGKEIIVNGVIRNDMLYVSHINGIWLRMPREMPDLIEMKGTLENINGSFYINDTLLIIKHGFSKSDIDGDGLLEKMYEELNGLVGKEITVDGFLNEKGFVVMHINGIWAR